MFKKNNGIPNEVIEYWNKFSIDLSEIIEGESIVIKSEKLIKEYLVFGNLFSELANIVCKFNFTLCDIIALNQDVIDNAGWSNSNDYKSITNHVKLDSFSKEQFFITL